MNGYDNTYDARAHDLIERLEAKITELKRQLEQQIEDQKHDIWRLEDQVSNLENKVRSLESDIKYK